MHKLNKHDTAVAQWRANKAAMIENKWRDAGWQLPATPTQPRKGLHRAARAAQEINADCPAPRNKALARALETTPHPRYHRPHKGDWSVKRQPKGPAPTAPAPHNYRKAERREAKAALTTARSETRAKAQAIIDAARRRVADRAPRKATPASPALLWALSTK
jgi:hypothetical protein